MSGGRMRLAVAAAFLALGAGACGGDGQSEGGAQTTSPAPGGQAPPEDRQQALQAFTECMREEGVDLPDGPPAGGEDGGQAPFDAGDPDVQQALEACRDELAGGAGPGAGGAGLAPRGPEGASAR